VERNYAIVNLDYLEFTAVVDGKTEAMPLISVLGTLGGVILALVVTHRLLDEDPSRGDWLMTWATPLSRHALSIYLVHHAVHVWPLWAAGLFTAGDATALWQLAMPVGWAIALAAAFLVAAAVAFRQADRLKIPTAESLMRWVCD